MDSPPSEVSPDNASNQGRNQGHHKKRIRVWTEDDRAKHRVFEKGRREAFSDSLLALARFLPALASVKESKLSKHTIVDESLKYHEVQKTKLDDLQKTIDALEAEKGALLTELAGWRECLDVPSEPIVPAELLETSTTTAIQGSNDHVSSNGLDQFYNNTAIPEPPGVLSMPTLPPVESSMPANAVLNPIPATQLITNYTLQASVPALPNDAPSYVLPRTSQYPTDSGAYNESQYATWSPRQSFHAHQTLWPQPLYQDLPVDFDNRRF